MSHNLNLTNKHKFTNLNKSKYSDKNEGFLNICFPILRTAVHFNKKGI